MPASSSVGRNKRPFWAKNGLPPSWLTDLNRRLVGGQLVRQLGPRQGRQFRGRCIDHRKDVAPVAVGEQLVEIDLPLAPGDVAGDQFGDVGVDRKVIASIVDGKAANEERQGDSAVSKSRAKVDSRDNSCFQHLSDFLLQPGRGGGFDQLASSSEAVNTLAGRALYTQIRTCWTYLWRRTLPRRANSAARLQRPAEIASDRAPPMFEPRLVPRVNVLGKELCDWCPSFVYPGGRGGFPSADRPKWGTSNFGSW